MAGLFLEVSRYRACASRRGCIRKALIGGSTMRSVAHLASKTLTFILAGGKGERLYPLTADQPKPALPFGDVFRIIDFTLSNVLNSGLRHIYLLTQYKQERFIRMMCEKVGLSFVMSFGGITARR